MKYNSIVATPLSLTCYYSKTTTNTNASSKFTIQVSSNGTTWTTVATGLGMDKVTKGTWYELSADLSSYSNVYVRVRYDGTTGVRALDDITLTYDDGQSPSTDPVISFTPASVTLDDVLVNNEASTTFTVSQSNLDAGITLSVNNGELSQYSIDKDADPTSIIWTYTPTAAGAISATVTATSGETSQTLEISGTAIAPVEGYDVDFEYATNMYPNWTFTNMTTQQNSDITAHGGTYYGTTGGKATASLTTSDKVENPGTLTCYVSKASNNTTSSTWYIQVSTDGSSWTNVNSQDATSMSKGTWVEFTADLSNYSNVYVRIYYNGSTAVRTIDDLTLTTAAPSNIFTVTYNANGATSGTVPVDETQYDSDNNTVTVLGNTGNLAKAGYIWSGWNTQADGEGTTYQENETFTISASTTLYAKWNAKTITGLAYTGEPTKTEYLSGESFDPTGLTVTATFNDESQEDVTTSVVWTPDPLTTGTTSVTGTYMGQTINVTTGLTVTAAPGSQENPYTVAQAIANTPSSGNVYIHGIVSSFYNTSIVGDGTNYRYRISDDGTTTTQLLVYKGKGLNQVTFTNANDLLVGDEVVICGTLNTYNNNPQIASGNYLTSWERPAVDVEVPTFSVEAGGYATEQTVELTCATEGAIIKYSYDNETWYDYSEALAINETKTVYAKAIKDASESAVASAAYYILSNDNTNTVTQALAFETYPQNNIFVEGIVSTAPTSLLDGGLLTYYISVDGTETNRLQVYKGKNLGNIEFTAADNIQVGDVVTIFGNVKVYNNQKEFDQGNYLVTWERLETVATPTFKPAEGEYTEAQSVIIACTTDDATIYYKTAENEEWAVYSEAIDVDETTTIWAYAAKEGMNNSAVATATYTINIPVITASITVEPALVEATAEGGDGTLTVTYENITEIIADVYFCDAEGEAASYDWITAEINNENNVEYLIVENDGEARTAYFKVYALDDDANMVYSNLVTINQAAYIAPSQEVVDVLDNNFTGITGTTYTEWTNTGTSDAVYVGFSAGQNSTIQLRTKNSNEGIITTTSGGKVTKVEVTWNDNTSSGRKLDIYGKNTAYSEVSDLYNNEKQGTNLGTIEYDNNTALIITDDYEFIGIRSNSGALYLDEIQITWSTTPAGPSITVTPAEITDVSAAGDIPEHTVILANLNISSTDDFLFAYCDLEGNILGNTDPKPNWIELAEAEYTATGENVYSMVYTVAANEETTPRTGYFKIGIEQATETVYSNIVTVTQLGYVTPVATITVVPNEVLDVPAAGDVYVHTVTLENMTVESTDDFTLAFCDENGDVLDEQAPKPDWIEIGDVEFAVTSEENVYSLTYPVAENTETTPRTAYFKVAATQTSEAVYSNLVTVTQAGYVPPVVAEDYELFSGDLVEGDYIIYYNGYAMKNTISSNRLTYETVTPSENVISTNNATIVWHIASSGNYWTIYSADANAYAASTGTKNQAQMLGDGTDDKALWTVSGTSTYNFVNKYNTDNSVNANLRNNGTYGFACYATGTGGALSLYKKVDNTPSISFNGSSANIGTYPTGEEITLDNIIVSQHNLTENISLNADKGTVTPNIIEVGANPTEIVWRYTPTEAGYTTATITATSGTIEDSFEIQFVAKTPHNINIASVENGTIAVVGGKETEIEGENVDFTVTPDEGYVIDEITVMAGENPVDYIQGETFYRFQMPDSDVTISATFNALPTYTIKFYVNGEQDEALTISDIVEGNSTALPTASTLTPAGFSIAGWAEEGSTIAVADPYTPTDNVNLYALFQLDNAQTTSGNFVKVTEELTDWSGEYLIVYEDGNVAFNGNLETFDAVENTVNVEIASSTIIANDAMNNASFTIAPMTGGYSIQGTSGKYIGVGSYANGLTTNDDPVANAISIDESGNALITITFTGGDMTLKYNDAENQLRFRYYKSGQKDIQLYKKESTSFNTITILDNTIPEQTISDPIPNATCVVVPNNVTLTYTGPNPSTPEALVVQEGGQLIHTADVEATVQKSVSGYTNKSGDGWYLISSPVDNYSTSTIATGTYDLFIYNEPNAYWYSSTGAAAPFNTLECGKGYLYANAANVNLNYAGTMKATNANITVDLSYACDDYPDLKGFNLVGNPFTRNLAYGDMTIIGGEVATSYLILNNDEDYEECNLLNGDEIKPGQGFFIQATAANQRLEFNPSSKDMSAIGLISIKAGDENYTDKAYIQFGGGNTLRKMTFGENTMVYVMNDDDDYAAARVEELAGTIPVHFVPIADGFYTITVETKNIENLNYMHLIDNIKNTEIDLLVEPSYTFKASESDNADRFYLVFDFNNYTGVNENYTNDNFAHQIGDEIFVSGEGTLQVFDVLGRFVTGYNVNGDKRISTAEFNTGVYIFRMVGTEVKTQKIIVR